MLISISKHLMLKFIDQAVQELILATNFKTSYVEVYLRCHIMCIYLSEFQNILCWSLSRTLPAGLSRIPRFQNILCWSLSSSGVGWQKFYIDFKTSYVEVYLGIKDSRFAVLSISKHLMLKFIRGINGLMKHFNIFQNILCWSLSHIFSLLLSIFPFIFPDFYHFYQASAHILFPIQYLTNSPTLQYFLNIFLFFAW